MTQQLFTYLVPILFLLAALSFQVGIFSEDRREHMLGHTSLTERELGGILIAFFLSLGVLVYYATIPQPEHDFDDHAVYLFDVLVAASMVTYFWMGQRFHRAIRKDRTRT